MPFGRAWAELEQYSRLGVLSSSPLSPFKDPTRGRRRRLFQRFFPALMVSLCLAVPALGDGVGTLKSGEAVERRLEAEGADLFQAELEAGEPWLVTVEQLGIDVVLEVREPGGESRGAVDNPLGREGRETLLLTSEQLGIHEIEVRSRESGAPAGSYEIRLERPPSATAADRQRLKALEALTAAGRHYARSFDDLGDQAKTARQEALEQALEQVEEALRIWVELGDAAGQALASLLRGTYLETLGDYRGAVTSYGEALETWRELGDRAGQAAALDRLGLAHQYLGEHREALANLGEALTLRQRLGRRPGGGDREAETRNDLCLVLQKLGRFAAAGECYGEVLALARSLEDRVLQATVLNNLGGIYQNLGEPEPAFEHFRQALELRRALGDELGVGITLNNLGFYRHRLGEVEAALRDYAPALAAFERLGNRYWQARTLNNQGYAYLALGEPERARAHLRRALPLRREVGDRSGEAVTLRNLGRAAADLGEGEEAQSFFRQALAASQETGDPRGIVTARRLLGEEQLRAGRAEEAQAALQEVVTALSQMGKRDEEGEARELLARAHLALRQQDQAAERALEALALEKAVKDPVGELAALATLARARLGQGRAEEARRHLEEAAGILEGLQGRLGDPSQRAAFLATQRRVYELHVMTLMELHRRSPDQGFDQTALEVSERARSRALLALLARPGAGLGAEADEALRQRLESARRRVSAKTQRQLQVLAREHAAEEAQALEQEVYEAMAELDAVRAEIRRLHPRSHRSEHERTLKAAEIRRLLPAGTVLLEYLLGDEKSFLWRVTAEGVSAHELPPRAEIEGASRQVHRGLSEIHGDRAALRRDLAVLGEMLLGPVAARLGGERLVVVADGALHLLPFVVLPRPGSEAGAGQPLLDSFEVVHLPSASVLALQQQAPKPWSRRGDGEAPSVAIFADPIFGPDDSRLARAAETSPDQTASFRSGGPGLLGDLVRLPQTRREAEAIAGLLPLDRRLLALGAEARRSRLLGGGLHGYDVLHLATHGFFEPTNPALSGLVLSRLDEGGAPLEGFLSLHDVAELELSAELVVLSGCRTALGREIRGEGLVGLTRGFMYAGVPRVVASLWQVRDEATAELMVRFYRGLLVEGQAPAAALRAAQLSLRQERRWRDPFYWGAFVLQGSWR